MKKIKIFLSVIAILFFVACNKDTVEPISLNGGAWDLKNVYLKVYDSNNLLKSSSTIPANDFHYSALKTIEFGTDYIYFDPTAAEPTKFSDIVFLDSIAYTLSGNRILITPVDTETELLLGHYSLTSTTLSILNVEINQDGFGKTETTLNYTRPIK